MSSITPESTPEDKIPLVTNPTGKSTSSSSTSTTGDSKTSKSPLSPSSTSDGNVSVNKTSPSDDDSMTTADGIDDLPPSMSSSSPTSSSGLPMNDVLPPGIEKNRTGPFPLPTPFEPPVSYPTQDVADAPSPSPSPALNSDSNLNGDGDPATNLNDNEDPAGISKDQKLKDNEVPPISPRDRDLDSPKLDAGPSLAKARPDLDVDLPIVRPSHVGLNFDIDSTNTHFHMPIGHNNAEESAGGIHWFEADVELPVCNEKSFLDEKVKCRAVLESLGPSINNRGKKTLHGWLCCSYPYSVKDKISACQIEVLTEAVLGFGLDCNTNPCVYTSRDFFVLRPLQVF